MQPLPGKVHDERLGRSVGEHALHLLLQHDRILQPALLGQIEQLDRPACCSRGKTTGATRDRYPDASDLTGAAPRISFDAEEEIRRDEHRFEGALDAGVEVAAGPARS